MPSSHVLLLPHAWRGLRWSRAHSLSKWLGQRMSHLRLLPIVAATLLAIGGRPLVAQLPSPSDAQALLQSRPDLVNQLRQRISTSGMTPDQIRARLQAAGYPSNLLDSYLPGAGATTGSASGATGTGSELDVLTAAKQLGIVDSTDLAFPGNAIQQNNNLAVPNCDTLVTDTTSARRS